MNFSIIIPAHNEEEVISKTILAFQGQPDKNFELIVIDDHSTDKTASIVEELAKKYPNLRLVANDKDKGFAAALRKGFSVFTADFAIPVMADLCDDPLTVPQMYKKALEGFDIVVGSRYMKGGGRNGGPLLQSLFSSFVGRSLRFLIGVPTSDASNSFKCYARKVIEAVKPQGRGFEISMEMVLKAYFAGFSITEVPTVWKGRCLGKSKFHLYKVAPRYIKLYLWAVWRKLISWEQERR